MGLLTEGTPFSWEETKAHSQHVRRHGVKQFVKQYRKLKGRTKDVLYWGDEVEYMLIKLDQENRRAALTLKSSQLLKKLQEPEEKSPDTVSSLWRPEYAEYMVEGTPGRPFGGLMAHFNVVEANMKLRRQQVTEVLGSDEIPLCLTSYPRNGCPNFTFPLHQPHPWQESGAARSLFFPDDAITMCHPRFLTLTRNIRMRRGEKVAINIPNDGQAQMAALLDHIYMDAMGFGMGCCCLQLTFQACNIDEARLLYDQLVPLSPIMMALSAASPIFRGYLADTDCRWTVIAQSVDDRTREERGLEPLKSDKFIINKSRYDSIDSYLSYQGRCYNDLHLVYDTELYQELLDGGIDDILAKHVAHLFIRDPISLFTENLNQNDETDTDHFENIQSTNWQTLRFKPPPPNSNIGWRVEFRPMEVQLSDFENAAYVVFIVLVTRVILTYKLNFLIPISKVDENMKTAHKRDAVREGRFFFRKDVITDSSPPEAAECVGCCDRGGCQKINEEYALMSINEVINGKEDFPGLIPLVNKYLESVECDVDTRCTILQYLKLISNRASGELMTTARWIRHFVTHHPNYEKDSIITEQINFDLICRCAEISSHQASCPDLLPNYSTRTQDAIPAALTKAEEHCNKKFCL